jgi:two-component system response regulator FixJ
MDCGFVYVIDDDTGASDALAAVMGEAGLASRAYDSPLAFVRDCDDLEPGCVVTDVRMPGMDGISLMRLLKAKNLPHPVIVMTGHGETSLAVEAFKAGAFDFIEKPLSDALALSAVRAALDAAQQVAHPPRVAARAGVFANFTRREREVFDGMMEGKRTKAIAYHLGLSPRTIDIYRANVMLKSGAGSLAELVRLAMDHDQAGGRA